MYLQDYENENVCTDSRQSPRFNQELKYPVHIILPQTQGNHHWDFFTSQVRNFCMAVRFSLFFYWLHVDLIVSSIQGTTRPGAPL